MYFSVIQIWATGLCRHYVTLSRLQMGILKNGIGQTLIQKFFWNYSFWNMMLIKYVLVLTSSKYKPHDMPKIETIIECHQGMDVKCACVWKLQRIDSVLQIIDQFVAFYLLVSEVSPDLEMINSVGVELMLLIRDCKPSRLILRKKRLRPLFVSSIWLVHC